MCSKLKNKIKPPKTVLKEIEISDLLDKEFKIMVMKSLTEHT